MNIIIFPRSCLRLLYVEPRKWYRAGLLAGAMLTLTVLLGCGYMLGLHFGNEVILSQWKDDIAEHEERLQLARQETRAEVSALTTQAGMLQAQVQRIDVLGSVLIEMTGLEPEEFSFEPESGIGGPAPVMDAPDGRQLKIESEFEQIQNNLEARERQLQVIRDALVDEKVRQETEPQGRPVEYSWVSSLFGKRRDPFTGHPELHHGVDFAGQSGSNVMAVAGGIVTRARRNGDYGKLVEIDHGNGYMSRYAHNKVLLVKAGEVVRRGHVIAKLGNTGRSTGPHVHFEILKDGVQIDPMKFVK
ncbi:MAG: M23 family metallopeptidase [Gammaproteobacteria bacterium]|nr:M23 family metallopeptidase [Gammaproteobacteria bacterium]